jgi:hypothetical protein
MSLNSLARKRRNNNFRAKVLAWSKQGFTGKITVYA